MVSSVLHTCNNLKRVSLQNCKVREIPVLHKVMPFRLPRMAFLTAFCAQTISKLALDLPLVTHLDMFECPSLVSFKVPLSQVFLFLSLSLSLPSLSLSLRVSPSPWFRSRACS